MKCAPRTRAPIAGILVALVAVSSCACSRQAKEARYLESGQRYFQKKDYSRAMIQFSNAAKTAPNDAEPHYRLGLAYVEMRDPQRAAGHLKRAVELNPKHAAAQLKLAQLLLTFSNDKTDLAKADELVSMALKLSQSDPEAFDTAAYAEWRLGRPEDAEQHLQRALERFPAHLKSAEMLASFRVARKDFAGAEAILKKAVEQAPSSPEPLLSLGQLHLLLGRAPEAEAEFQRALKIDPKHAPTLFALATLRLRGGKRDEAEQIYRRLSTLPQKEFQPVLGMFLLQQGRLDQALAEFERLAKADPKDRTARSRLVSVCVRAGKLGEAEKILAAALKANPKDVDALLQRSSLLVGQRKYTEAQPSVQALLGLQPDSGPAHYLQARIYLARGEGIRARQELDGALRLDPALLAARIALADLLLGSNSAKTALDILDQAPKEQRESLPLRIKRNWALLAVGGWAEARKEIDRGLAAAKAPELLLQDGLLKVHEKDYSGARASLAEALKQNPEDLRVLNAWMATYAAQNQPQAALNWLREHAARYPQSATLQYFLGESLLANGKPGEARTALTAAAALRPDLLPAQLALARIDLAERKLGAARQRVSSLLSRGENAAARLLLGNIEELAGNPSAAIEQYRKLVQLDGRNVVALNNLAYLLANHSNQPDEALKYAQQAAEISPNNPAIEDTLGWVYFQKGLYGTALPYLESAAGRSDATARRKYHLAMAYLKSGERARGQRLWRRRCAWIRICRRPASPARCSKRPTGRRAPFGFRRKVLRKKYRGFSSLSGVRDQVRYPYAASVEDSLHKLEYDLFYLKNMSILFDWAILFETIRIVLSGRGGR